jgi:serine phosphatase RsbU (regulator of sigma subunit)/anti-sigma regulatory factor (Ser/Thr protein kinase)
VEAVATISRGLLVLAFAAIAVVSLREWRRKGDAPTLWVFASFALLTVVATAGALIPDRSESDVLRWIDKLVVAALPVFPYCLLRFRAAMTPTPRALKAIALGLTALVVALTLALPLDTLSEGGSHDAWFQVFVVVLLLQWSTLSVVVATLLWRDGSGQPTVARRRMRTLAVASIGMTLALVLAGASGDGGSFELAVGLVGLVSAGLFFVALLPPPWLRAVWRRPEEERLRAATAGLMRAGAPEEVIAGLMPDVAALVGARGVALTGATGELIAAHGDIGGDVPGERLELRLAERRLTVWTGPYAPFFGREELELLRSLGTLAELALQRWELFERELEERDRRLLEQAARAEAEATTEMVRHVQAITDTALANLTLDGLVDELLARTREILEVETATILLLDDDGETLVPQATRGLEEPPEVDVRVRVGEGFAGRIAAERRAVTLDDVKPGDVVRPLILERGIRSLLGVPMVVAGRLTGVMHVGTLEPHRFTAEDAGLLQLVADRAALAIEHGRLYGREHRIAETLQRSLLSDRLPELPGIAVAARYLPGGAGAVGGDWYDLIPLAGGRVGVAMGDVVGHGIGAASLMGQLRSGLRAYALDGHAPAGVLKRLDRLIRSLHPEGMATLLYLVYDPDGGTASFASAGHPPPLLLDPDDGARYVEDGVSVPLGVLRGASYSERTVALAPGSTLVMYTDGVVERRGEALDTGLDLLKSAAVARPDDVDGLCDHVLRTLLPDGPASDDAALIALRVIPARLEDLRVRLPAEPESLATLRGALRRWLADAGVSGQLAHDVLVSSGEACANAIEHAYGARSADFELVASLAGDELVLTVRDSGRWRPRRTTDGGRGLMLMNALMDDVDVVTDTGGTTVVLRQRLREALAA